MDGQIFGCFDRTTFIDRFTNDVHDTTKCAGLALDTMLGGWGSYADRDFDRCTGRFDGLTTDKTFCTVHGNASNGVFSEMLCDFKDEPLPRGRVYSSVYYVQVDTYRRLPKHRESMAIYPHRNEPIPSANRLRLISHTSTTAPNSISITSTNWRKAAYR